jgi:hypothetical protein
VAKALLTAVIVVGLIFPSAGACIESAVAHYAMPCCAGASCAMGGQMRGGSCCAKVQGEFSKTLIAPPTSPIGLPTLAGAVRLAMAVPADRPLRTLSCAYSPPSSALPPHPLQI